MLRISLLIACALLLPSVAAAEPQLRANVVVNAPVIRLGDLFSDAGVRADATLAPAPPPGGKIVFDAAWLDARAREQNLSWQPRSRYDQATVERASEMIGVDAIAAELRRQLADQLPAGPVQLNLDNAALHLFVPAGTPTDIAVSNLTYNAQSGRLAAYVAAPADDPNAERIRVTGRVYRMVELPVLTRPVSPGETIADSDVETIAVHSDRMTESYVAAVADLVGKTPRRPIRPGEPIRPSDVQIPILIHKGDLVTVMLQTPTIVVTAQAKALEDGAQGAAIRVANTRSGRVLDGVATSSDTVSVTMMSSVAAR